MITNAARLIVLLLIGLSACASGAQASELGVTDPSVETALPDEPQGTDPLSCTDRTAIPLIDNAFDAHWAPDSQNVVVSRIVTIPNKRTITGYEEDQRLTLLNVATGAVRELGQGSKPSFSGSGAYLSYWRDGEDDMRVILGSSVAAYIASTEPQVRWVGDELYFFHNDEIRVWKAGLQWTVAHVPADLTPRYPRDDANFSADGQQFTITRYYQNGATERYLGITRTGEVTGLDGAVTFSEWSPVGHTLLERTADGVALVRDDGRRENARVADLLGRVHGWTADGRLLFGTLSPTVPGANAFDRFAVWGSDDLATLPNLFGVRTFSPDSRFFVGTSRTGLYPTQLEVYRCGAANVRTDQRADTAARSRQARIDSDSRRFVRPVSGAISQFVQGSHTGIDVSAPYGAIIVAADDGVVDAVGWVPVGGQRVCVQHANGLESCDYHTSLPLVSIGDRVARGQPVALVGMTGQTSAPHVHWEARRNGMIVDPLQQ